MLLFPVGEKVGIEFTLYNPGNSHPEGKQFELVGIRVIGVDRIFNLLCDFLELHWVYTIECKITYFIDKTVTWLRDLLWQNAQSCYISVFTDYTTAS